MNVSIFAKRASRVDLLLFDSEQAAEPSTVIALDPHTQRTYHYCHTFVPGVGAGQVCAEETHYALQPRSVVFLLARVNGRGDGADTA